MERGAAALFASGQYLGSMTGGTVCAVSGEPVGGLCVQAAVSGATYSPYENRFY